MPECNNCGERLPYDPQASIHEGTIECMVEFTYSTGPSVETEHFCDPECFGAQYGGDSE